MWFTHLGTTQYHVCTALRTATEAHVPEILRDAGPKVTLCPSDRFTTAIDLLLRRENTSRKLLSPPTSTLENWVRIREGLIYYLSLMFAARILRLLATNHIFTEVTPDVFANNRLSSVLDTGKPVEELLARLVPKSNDQQQ